jgi:hypothetical protein
VAGSAQFMPWACVDTVGGLNVMFYTISRAQDPHSTDRPWVAAMYFRIPTFSAPPQPNVARMLTPTDFQPADDLFRPNVPHIMGDYNMIASGGCWIYPAYMSNHENTPLQPSGPAIYMNRIKVCIADVTADGAVTGDDAIAFGSAYIAGAPEADVNENGVVQPSDVALFQEAYTCGCGTP